MAQDVKNSLDVEPKFIFGLTNNVSGNCLFLNDNEIVYPASGLIVVYNVTNHSQKFIKLLDPRRIVTAMDLNTTKQLLIVATVGGNSGGNPTIDAYDVKSLRHLYVFVPPDDKESIGRRRCTRLQFSYENISVAALFTDADRPKATTMYYYAWENSMVETQVLVGGLAVDMALNPIDTTICCFVGKDLFKLMTRSDTGWSQYGFYEANGINFTCVCWLCGDRCVAGTADGRVILFKSGSLQAMYQAHAIRTLDVTINTVNGVGQIMDGTPPSPLQLSLLESGPRAKQVRTCFIFKLGLVLIIGDATVYFFEKTEDGQRYMLNGVFTKREDRYLNQLIDDLPFHYVEFVTVSLSGDKLACVTRRAQLYWAPVLCGHEFADSPTEFLPFGQELHYGPVASLSTCLWKPMFMTCGKIDFTIKVWDYERCTVLQSKYYQRQVYSVSMHPTGLYAVASFSDHAEFQLVKTADLEMFESYPILGCTITAFSTSGHMFALANAHAIDIYCSVSFKKILTLKHFDGNSMITALAWSDDDMHVVTCDMTGTIYKFNTKTGDSQIIDKPKTTVLYTDVAVSKDGAQIFVTTENVRGLFKEISDQQGVREMIIHENPLNAIAFTKSNSILFVATRNGVVLSIKLPITVRIIFNQFEMHNHSITKMCLAMDDSVLITCSEDGNICIWKVKHILDEANEIDNRFMYSDDILVSWPNLEKINKNVKNIETKLNELNEENAYTVKILKEVTEQELENAIKTYLEKNNYAKKQNKELVDKQSITLKELEFDTIKLKEKNQQNILNFEAECHKKLAIQHQKYFNLEDKMIDMSSKLEKDFEKTQAKLNKEIQNTMSKFKTKIKEKDEDISKLKENLIEEIQVLQRLISLTEDDVDKDILEKKTEFLTKIKKMKTLYFDTLRDLRDYKLKLDTQNSTINDLNRLSEEMEKGLKHLKLSNADKITRAKDLKLKLKVQNEIIPQKDLQIETIKNEMINLEEKIELYNIYISDLKLTIKPLELKIQEKNVLIKQMENKYDTLLKKKKELESYFNELKVKTSIHTTDIMTKKKNIEDEYAVINQIINDIEHTKRLDQDPKKIKLVVAELYYKYADDSDFNGTKDEELHVREEFLRHRNVLESSIEKLKCTIKLMDTKTESYYLIMEKNSQLISEIKEHRNQLENIFSKLKKVEHVMLANSTEHVEPSKNNIEEYIKKKGKIKT